MSNYFNILGGIIIQCWNIELIESDNSSEYTALFLFLQKLIFKVKNTTTTNNNNNKTRPRGCS